MSRTKHSILPVGYDTEELYFHKLNQELIKKVKDKHAQKNQAASTERPQKIKKAA